MKILNQRLTQSRKSAKSFIGNTVVMQNDIHGNGMMTMVNNIALFQ